MCGVDLTRMDGIDVTTALGQYSIGRVGQISIGADTCCLIAFIDDATGALLQACFYPVESTNAYQRERCRVGRVEYDATPNVEIQRAVQPSAGMTS